MMEVIALPRNRCSVLPLVLKGKWYDMIASGEKREEYRDWNIWSKRISNWLHRFNQSPGVEHLVVAFQRGYRRPSMWFEACVSSESTLPPRRPHPEWGEPNGPHFVIALGGRIELTDSENKEAPSK